MLYQFPVYSKVIQLYAYILFQIIFDFKLQCFPLGASGEETVNAGDMRDVGLIPGSGRSPRGGNGNPLQYTCLENSMDRGAWWATVHSVGRVGHD